MQSNEIRRIAREHLKGNWGLSIGVAAVAVLLGGTMCGSRFLPDLSGSLPRNLTQISDIVRNIRINYLSSLLGLASFILGGVLQLGYARFLLKQHDGRNPEFGDLFSQFDRFGTGFAQAFLRGLYTFLWSLLLVIPGIIKALSYSMTPYILEDCPDLTASEAISRSKALMDGHKMDLFILHLTFIGWKILCALTMNLGFLFLNPYENAAEAAFYRDITSRSQENRSYVPPIEF